MNAEEMWAQFAARSHVDAPYEAWAFGCDADKLAQLVLEGTKTATASAFPLYAVDQESLPEAGQYSVILDSNDEAVCIIRCTGVTMVPFSQVSEDHAYREGEGDRSLEYWRTVHREIFQRWMQEAQLTFSEDMPVVCETFRRVFP